MTVAIDQTSERATGSPTRDAAAVLAEAHHYAVSATPAEMAKTMRAVFGQNLAALILGVEHPTTVGKWTRGQVPHRENLSRLRDTFQIIVFLERMTTRQTVQAWFMGMNPDLGDRAPALVLADDPLQMPQLLRAARSFVARG